MRGPRQGSGPAGRVRHWRRSAADVLVGGARLTRALRPWRPGTWRAVHRHGLTVAALVATAAGTHPDATALVDDDGPLTYGGLERYADRLQPAIAVLLPGSGTGTGTGSVPGSGSGPDLPRVGLLCRNGRGFVAALVAGSRLRCDLVLLDPDGAPARLAAVVATERIDLLVVDGDDVTTPPSEVPLLDLRTLDGDGPPSSRSAGPARSGRRGRLVVLTSGTTGAPRGVHRPGVRAGQVIPLGTLVHRIPVTRGTSMVLTPPLFHGYGLGFLVLGLAFRLPVLLGRRLDVPRVDAQLLAPGTILVGVPPVLARIERATGPRVVTAVVSGAGHLHPSVAAQLLASYGPTLFNLYGSSEEGWSTLATPEDLVAAPGTIGYPATGVRIEVLADDGRPLAAGTVGNLCVTSRLEFDTYTGGGRRRRLAGLAVTGDLGHRDRAGRLFVDGRSDDVAVVGGENVLLPAVEDALLSHPAVADARVDAVPDVEYGRRLEALVVLVEGAAASGELAQTLIGHAQSQLSRHLAPRRISFVDTLPQTATGKHRRDRAAE